MTADRDALALCCAGTRVADYVFARELDATLAPRPYLHPVRTLDGVVVTELFPVDHAHHLGVSVAIADVGGRNFWGGRTFVRDSGSVWLTNHGRQRHTDWLSRTASGFVERLRWTGADGRDVFSERRAVTVRPLDERAWLLDFAVELTNVTTGTVLVRSPATNGRPGAGYGGFFWRLPAASRELRVFTAAEEGETAVHGCRADWLAVRGRNPDGAEWSLVFLADDHVDPWFVRVDSYPAVGTALAWHRPLAVPAGQPLIRRMSTVITDGPLSTHRIATLVDPTRVGRHGARPKENDVVR